jgi:hypothetical protein
LLIYILPFGTSTNNNDIDSDLEIQEAAVWFPWRMLSEFIEYYRQNVLSLQWT